MAEISTIARPYAVAIFNLAKEENTLSEWSDMLSSYEWNYGRMKILILSY